MVVVSYLLSMMRHYFFVQILLDFHLMIDEVHCCLQTAGLKNEPVPHLTLLSTLSIGVLFSWFC